MRRRTRHRRGRAPAPGRSGSRRRSSAPTSAGCPSRTATPGVAQVERVAAAGEVVVGAGRAREVRSTSSGCPGRARWRRALEVALGGVVVDHVGSPRSRRRAAGAPSSRTRRAASVPRDRSHSAARRRRSRSCWQPQWLDRPQRGRGAARRVLLHRQQAHRRHAQAQQVLDDGVRRQTRRRCRAALGNAGVQPGQAPDMGLVEHAVGRACVGRGLDRLRTRGRRRRRCGPSARTDRPPRGPEGRSRARRGSRSSRPASEAVPAVGRPRPVRDSVDGGARGGARKAAVPDVAAAAGSAGASSRDPVSSNRHSSTAFACAEKTARLTPLARRSLRAARRPSSSAALTRPATQEHGGQRRQVDDDRVQLVLPPQVLRHRHRQRRADVAAAVVRQIGVQAFAVGPAAARRRGGRGAPA